MYHGRVSNKALVILLVCGIAARAGNPAAAAAHNWRISHQKAILDEFDRLLSIPNIASDQTNISRNATTIAAMMRNRGIATQLLQIPLAPALVYGAVDVPDAVRTVVFYAHYDGQPLDPKEWATNPWTPTLKGDRIYARSSSDDKAAIIALLTAFDALKAASIPLHQNIRFVFEGEEEAGSPHLLRYLAMYKNLLKADLWLICDGPINQSGRRQIVFGARGIETVDITVYGANRELHSGHYGNWAPNPAMMLAHLLASMKNGDGRVTVDHFYDGIVPLTATEKRAVAEAPDVDRQLERDFALGRTEGGGRSLVELLNLPSLNVRGMASARVGPRASNVIPSTATASIDMRLVKGMDHDEAARRLVAHIRKQGYFVVDRDPDAETLRSHPKVAKVVSGGGYNAERTSMDLPISKLVLRTADSLGQRVVRLPTMGGSVPLYLISGIFGSPSMIVPIANFDNNQHSFNENIRLGNLWDGIDLMAALEGM
jgi:acetylornithine deacetylase/succinyl-diaminopimelate desuccinylase-like protein